MQFSREWAIRKIGVKTYQYREKLSIRRFLIFVSEYFLHFEFICHRTGLGVKRNVQKNHPQHPL